MSRQQHVYSTGSQVAHIWAQQGMSRQQHAITWARNGSNSIYFQSSIIYSYGAHFPVAQFHKNTAGETCVLFTTERYSLTTAKHISYAARAIPHSIPVFNCPLTRKYQDALNNDPKAAHTFVMQWAEQQVSENIVKASRARSNASYLLQTAADYQANANRYLEFMGDKRRVDKLPADFDALMEQAQIKRARAEEQAAERYKNRAARRAELDKQHAAEWRAGAWNGVLWHAPVMLRIKGDEIETSRGARIPLDHAPHLFKLWRTCIDTGRDYQRNGHTEYAGTFAIDSITADGTLLAGCHVIDAAELERMAQTLGYMPAPVADNSLHTI